MTDETTRGRTHPDGPTQPAPGDTFHRLTDVTQIVGDGGEGIRTYTHEIAGQRVERLWPPDDDLEQGGVWHSKGTLPCVTGRPYPHNHTAECRMVDRDPHEAVVPLAERTPIQRFMLPTVGALRLDLQQSQVDNQRLLKKLGEALDDLGDTRRQITNLTNERDHLATTLENAPTAMDWAAATADRENLRTRLTTAEEHIARITAAATIVNDLAQATETDRDQILADRQALQGVITELQAQLGDTQAERDDLRGQMAEYEQLFELQHTRTREADERWRAEDPETRKAIHPDLGVLLTWLMTDADNARTQLATAASDRDKAEAWIAELVGPAFDLIRTVRNHKRGDSTGRLDNHASKLHAALRCESGDTITDRIARTERERDSLARRLSVRFEETQKLRQQLVALDRARTTLALSAHGLIGALDEGDLDTVGFIERMREALSAVETGNIRIGLTDKGAEYLDANPSATTETESFADASGEGLARSGIVADVNDSGRTVGNPSRSMHKGHYGVPQNDHDETQTPVFPSRYVMATTAIHTLGDISRDQPCLAHISGETDTDWIGSWVEGYGYINVHFPKATTRELTPAEAEAYDGQIVAVGTQEQGHTIHIPRDVEDGDQ